MAEAQAQIAVETMILLHSIRRILMWTLVIIPLLLVVLGIVLGVVAMADSSASELPSYLDY